MVLNIKLYSQTLTWRDENLYLNPLKHYFLAFMEMQTIMQINVLQKKILSAIVKYKPTLEGLDSLQIFTRVWQPKKTLIFGNLIKNIYCTDCFEIFGLYLYMFQKYTVEFLQKKKILFVLYEKCSTVAVTPAFSMREIQKLKILVKLEDSLRTNQIRSNKNWQNGGI